MSPLPISSTFAHKTCSPHTFTANIFSQFHSQQTLLALNFFVSGISGACFPFALTHTQTQRPPRHVRGIVSLLSWTFWALDRELFKVYAVDMTFARHSAGSPTGFLGSCAMLVAQHFLRQPTGRLFRWRDPHVKHEVTVSSQRYRVSPVSLKIKLHP